MFLQATANFVLHKSPEIADQALAGPLIPHTIHFYIITHVKEAAGSKPSDRFLVDLLQVYSVVYQH